MRDGKLAVARGPSATVYEAAVPWSALGVKAPARGKRVAWSTTVNDNDGEGFRGWIEWPLGVCGGKAPARLAGSNWSRCEHSVNP